jgi:hypothetical protein
LTPFGGGVHINYRPNDREPVTDIGSLPSHYFDVHAQIDMSKSIPEPNLIVGTSSTTQHTDKVILDLEIYLSNSNHFRSFIYDHREIQCIADRFGLAPECIRSEIRRLGYQLTKNGHGRMIWKSKEGERMNYAKKIASLDEYISKCEARQLQFYDRSEIGRIAKRNGVDRDSVRAILRRRGYKLSKNTHNIAVWIKMQDLAPISLIAAFFMASVLSLETTYSSSFLTSYQFFFS